MTRRSGVSWIHDPAWFGLSSDYLPRVVSGPTCIEGIRERYLVATERPAEAWIYAVRSCWYALLA